MPSYDEVNYTLRPAKNIERKMFCDVFRRLTEFGSLESYRYIGLGSVYFSDFSLFHKFLNIVNNVSMEREIGDKERVLFNIPYSCIEMKWGESNEILPTLEWDMTRTITWLDYDDPLIPSMLRDVTTVCSYALSGSILIVTVDAEPDKMYERRKSVGKRLEKKLPVMSSEFKLGDWGTANFYREIINNTIDEAIKTRNGVLRSELKINYKQLFNFHYADGAKMLTVGGILFEEGQSGHVAKCEFDKFDFVSADEKAYHIDVPFLTLREIRHLNKQLPCLDISNIKAPWLSADNIARYEKIYRYFPTFVDAEIV